MEKRRISSIATYFYRIFFPTIIVLITFPAISSDLRFVFIPIVLALPIFLLAGLLKNVWIDGDDLIISDYFKTIRVPIESISSVSENFLFNPKLIWIHFKCPTAFGKKINFIPTFGMKDFFSQFTSHSVVAELRVLAEENKARNKTNNSFYPLYPEE